MKQCNTKQETFPRRSSLANTENKILFIDFTAVTVYDFKM